MILGEVELAVEHMQARVEFASLAFRQDLSEEGPDIGLRTEEFATFLGTVDFVHDPPRAGARGDSC